MKSTCVAVATTFCLALPAFAGGPAVVQDTAVLAPMPDAQPGPDWTGAYAGLAFGTVAPDTEDQNPAVSYEMDDGTLRSFFLGYRLQEGPLVYGAEVELANLSGAEVTTLPRELTKALDVKGTVGLAKGRFLTYGVLGWSQVEFTRPAESHNFGGISYGAGVEYSVSDRIGLGLEYLARDVDGVALNGSPQTSTIDADSLSLRIGFSF